jgi:hypothetical protein
MLRQGRGAERGRQAGAETARGRVRDHRRARGRRPEVTSARAGCEWRPATWERVRAGCGAHRPFRERHAGWVAGEVPSLAHVRVDQSEQSSVAGPARGGLKASCPAPGGVRRSGTYTEVRASAHARTRARASVQLEEGEGVGGGSRRAAVPLPSLGPAHVDWNIVATLRRGGGRRRDWRMPTARNAALWLRAKLRRAAVAWLGRWRRRARHKLHCPGRCGPGQPVPLVVEARCCLQPPAGAQREGPR